KALDVGRPKRLSRSSPVLLAIDTRLSPAYWTGLFDRNSPSTNRPPEETMRVRFGIRMFPIVLLAASIALPSFAATPAMEACSAKWANLNAANKTKGQTWPEFWSQCSKDFAAKNGTEPAQPEKTTSKKAAAKTAAVDEIPRARVNKRKPATRSGTP